MNKQIVEPVVSKLEDETYRAFVRVEEHYEGGGRSWEVGTTPPIFKNEKDAREAAKELADRMWQSRPLAPPWER